MLVFFVLLFQSDLEKAVFSFGDAFAASDWKTCKAMLHPDYIHINGTSGSVINGENWVAWLKTRQLDMDNGEYVIEVYEIQDLQIKQFGTVAYVTGIVRSSGRSKEGEFKSALRFSNVWVKSEGRWLRAAFHDSAISE